MLIFSTVFPGVCLVPSPLSGIFVLAELLLVALFGVVADPSPLSATVITCY